MLHEAVPDADASDKQAQSSLTEPVKEKVKEETMVVKEVEETKPEKPLEKEKPKNKKKRSRY